MQIGWQFSLSQLSLRGQCDIRVRCLSTGSWRHSWRPGLGICRPIDDAAQSEESKMRWSLQTNLTLGAIFRG